MFVCNYTKFWIWTHHLKRLFLSFQEIIKLVKLIPKLWLLKDVQLPPLYLIKCVCIAAYHIISITELCALTAWSSGRYVLLQWHQPVTSANVRSLNLYQLVLVCVSFLISYLRAEVFQASWSYGNKDIENQASALFQLWKTQNTTYVYIVCAVNLLTSIPNYC